MNIFISQLAIYLSLSTIDQVNKKKKLAHLYQKCTNTGHSGIAGKSMQVGAISGVQGHTGPFGVFCYRIFFFWPFFFCVWLGWISDKVNFVRIVD
jgi:hypothetical protein